MADLAHRKDMALGIDRPFGIAGLEVHSDVCSGASQLLEVDVRWEKSVVDHHNSPAPQSHPVAYAWEHS